MKSKRLTWRSSYNYGIRGVGRRDDNEQKAYKNGGFFTEANLLFLRYLRFVEIGHSSLTVTLILGVGLAGTVQLEKLLDIGITSCYDISTLLDDSVFGLDFLEEMLDFSREIRNLKEY